MMGKQHAPRFLEIVETSRRKVTECTVDDIKARLDKGDEFHLVDVREDREWDAGHLPGAIHIGKGVIERDIEKTIANPAAEIVLYCGGGYRSALAADVLQQMGYTNVISMDGGVRGWKEKNLPLEQ